MGPEGVGKRLKRMGESRSPRSWVNFGGGSVWALRGIGWERNALWLRWGEELPGGHREVLRKEQVSSRNLGLQPVKGRCRLAVVTMATKGGRPGGRCGT